MTEIYNAGNPYDVVRTSDGQYQASDGELVITDADTLQLPEPADGEYVLVKRAGVDYVDISTPVGNVGQIASVARFDGDDAVMFVSDGNDWYIRSDTLQLGTAISESAIAHYDAASLDLSDGETVTTWPDQTDLGNDLTDGIKPSFVENEMNGEPVVRFADTGDEYIQTGDFESSEAQPNTAIMAIKVRSFGAGDILFDGASVGDRTEHWARTFLDDTWSLSGNFSGGEQRTTATILTFVWDGSDSIIRQDGEQVAAGESDGNDLRGITIGTDDDDIDTAPLDAGEILVANDRLSDDDILFEEQRLGAKWGVNLS